MVTEVGGTFLQRAVDSIDHDRREAQLDDRSAIAFDAAIVCVGAKPRIVFGHAHTLRMSGEPIDIDAVLRQAAEHESRRIAFVLPPTGSWPLPVYELALMSQQRARAHRLELEFTIVTPEPEPLFVFGRQASDAIASLLAVRGIEVRTSARAFEDASGALVVEPGHERLSVGGVVALPELHGPALPGLPADQRGFIPIDEHARVHGMSVIYAAGDGTNFAIKHGGLGAQQADAAAEQIAADAGAGIDPNPFHPIIRGRLITGDETLSLQADIGGGGGEGSSTSTRFGGRPRRSPASTSRRCSRATSRATSGRPPSTE